jgi:hypothetical protein
VTRGGALEKLPLRPEGKLPLQVTKETVDEGIHSLAMRKLRLDAAVLDGITASADAQRPEGAATETAQVPILPTVTPPHYKNPAVILPHCYTMISQ